MENFLIVLVIATSPFWLAFGFIGLAEGVDWVSKKIKG
jgi:hypothetical protein